MKKLLTITILLLAFALLVAVESDPSNVVGYFKKNVPAGFAKPASIPFAYDDLSVDNVLGTQFAEEDRVIEANYGSMTDFIDGWGWFGDLVEFTYGGAYTVKRQEANGNLDYYLLGTVDPQPISVNIRGNGWWTAFSLNEATEIELTENFFGNNSNEDDRLIDNDTGELSEYFDFFGWFGDVVVLKPTNAYSYYVIPGAPDFTLNYPSGRGFSQPSPSFRSK